MTLSAITPREASIFACLADTVVAPEPLLPPVRETDAVAFFDRWMGRSPRLNRIGLRAVLYAVELGPRLTGFGARMRALAPDERARYLRGLEHEGPLQLRQLAELVRALAQLCYYGDDAVMLRMGYDAEANVRRGRELRAAEGRP